MVSKFAVIPLALTLGLSLCKKHETVQKIGEASTPAPVTSASPGVSAGAGASPATETSPVASQPKKVAVDQTAQTIVYGYHRFVNQVRRPDTEITPQAFEQQMQELKNRGITVIPMQDFLAWKRGEKNIPPRSAVITFDDGWKSQYEVAWPIMKKFGYPFTMFIYTEGVRGRYLIEENKPKVFGDAISMIATSSAGGAPVAEIGAANIQSKPADGETVRNPLPLISANLSAFGAIDPGTVTIRVSGLGVVPASYDAKTQTVSYEVTQKLRDKCSVIVEAKSGGKKVEAQ